MKLTYGTNIAAMRASRELTNGQNAISTLFERLSSGQRINRASDDAAGLAIADTLRADARIYQQAIRNLNDGISAFNIIDSALGELTNITGRLQELATQAANGSYSKVQRIALDKEAQALSDEYTRIVQSVEFNEMKLLNGDTQDITLQAGIGASAQLSGSIGGAFGTGAFHTDTLAIPTTSVIAMDSGDVNGDGHLDVVATTGSGLILHYGTGDGTFTDGPILGANTVQAQLVDLNGDGNLDILKAGSSNTLVTSLGNGDGTFSEERIISTSYTPGAIETGDFNGDGHTDVVVSSYSARFEILLGDGAGGLTAVFDTITVSAGSVSVIDANGDGLDDIALSGTGTSVYMSDGDGSFTNSITLNGLETYTALKTADFNGDGYEDIVANNQTDGQLSVWLGNASGGYSTETQYGSTGSVFDMETGDVNGDGIADIVYVDYASNSLEILHGNGDGTFANQLSVSRNHSAARILELDDFNNDGVLDALAGYIGFSLHLGETENGTAPLLSFSLESIADAKIALYRFTQKLEQLTTQRGEIGAFQSRIGHSVNVLTSTRENYLTAESRIRDADIAQDAAELVRRQILQQAQAAILGQANLQPEMILSLIRNSG